MNKKELSVLETFEFRAANKLDAHKAYIDEIYGHIATAADAKANSFVFQEIFNNKELFQLWQSGVERYNDMLRDYFNQYNRGVNIPEAEVERVAALRKEGIKKLQEKLAPILEQRLAARISKIANQGTSDRVESTKNLHERGLSLLSKYGFAPLTINLMHKKYHKDTAMKMRELSIEHDEALQSGKKSMQSLQLDAEDYAYFKLVDGVMDHFKQQKQPITKDEAITFANIIYLLDRLQKIQIELQRAQADMKDLGSKIWVRSDLQTQSATPRADKYLEQLFKEIYGPIPYLSDERREQILKEINSLLKASKKSPLTFRFEPLQPTATKQSEQPEISAENGNGLTR